jgi:membrane protein implicated in regulation of membrane protease activity
MMKFFDRLLSEDILPAPPLNYDDEGIVRAVIHPKLWRVDYKGTQWNARAYEDVKLKPGDVVYVVGRHNITLLIKPKPKDTGMN